jgi:hypothetical protein
MKTLEDLNMTVSRRSFIQGIGVLASAFTERASTMEEPSPSLRNGRSVSSLTDDLRNSAVANVKDYGAKGDGVTNDTDAINRALVADSRLYFPAGTYLCGPRTDPSIFLFPVGNRSGLEFFGDGLHSILKLADNTGRGISMFGSGNGQTVSKMHWHDLFIDLNGPNNLQATFGDPHRLNSFIYLFSAAASDILVERVYVLNASGSQMIRVSNDTATVSDRVTIRDCDFVGFGIGIPGNHQQDVSVIYVFGNGVTIENCRFRNDPFTMDLSRGHTAIELHSGHGHRVVNCRFEEVQVPLLSAADYGDIIAGEMTGCVILNCALGMSFDPSGKNTTDGFRFSHNQYRSNKPIAAGMIYVGNSAEAVRTRRNIEISDNQFEVTTNTQGRSCLMLVSSHWTSIHFVNNTLRNLTAQAIHCEGVVGDAGHSSLVITGNRFDSCGCSPFFPNDGSAAQIVISPSTTDAFSSVVIEQNFFANAAGRNYAHLGHVYLGANLRARVISVRMNVQPDDAFELVHDAGSIATVAKDITTANLGGNSAQQGDVDGGEVASAPSITLPTSGRRFNITGQVNITNIGASYQGRVVILVFRTGGGARVIRGGNLRLNNNDFVWPALGTLMLIADGVNWLETARSPSS